MDGHCQPRCITLKISHNEIWKLSGFSIVLLWLQAAKFVHIYRLQSYCECAGYATFQLLKIDKLTVKTLDRAKMSALRVRVRKIMLTFVALLAPD